MNNLQRFGACMKKAMIMGTMAFFLGANMGMAEAASANEEKLNGKDTNTTYFAKKDNISNFGNSIIIEQPTDASNPYGYGTIAVNTEVIATVDYVNEKFFGIEYDSIVSQVTSLNLDGSTLVLEQTSVEPERVDVDLSGLQTAQGSENAGKIAKNASDIKSNVEAIAQNASGIKTNAEAIAQNASGIKNNAEAIAQNASGIKNNADNIVQNATNIQKNADNISVLQKGYKGDEYITVVNPSEEGAGSISLNADKLVQNINAANEERFAALNSRVNKVGARAAALAALHPLDFDPEDKLTFSAGYGNYKGQNAAAIGAFYRPDEKVMVSVSGTMSGQENMINAGVSFSLDRTSHVTNSKTAMAKDIMELKAQNAEQSAQIQQLIQQNNMLMKALSGMAGINGKLLDTSKITMFPDVPANHWAYEYIEGLQKAGVLEGYPTGNFGGDRACTRYEFAAALYRAMKAGQVVPAALQEEFKEELGRFRVDQVGKAERVRVNTGKAYPDRNVYGSKVAQ